MRDYYKVLGVPNNASRRDIENAYHNLVDQFHPDRNPGDQTASDMLKMATEAYETLSDINERAAYDISRSERFMADRSTGRLETRASTRGGGGFDLVGFTCQFLLMSFLGSVVFLSLWFFLPNFFHTHRGGSNAQWLFNGGVPLVLALLRGFHPAASREPQKWELLMILITGMHVVLGLLVGVFYCVLFLWMFPGFHNPLYSASMEKTFLIGVPLWLGLMGGWYRGQFWEPLLNNGFVRLIATSFNPRSAVRRGF